MKDFLFALSTPKMVLMSKVLILVVLRRELGFDTNEVPNHCRIVTTQRKCWFKKSPFFPIFKGDFHALIPPYKGGKGDFFIFLGNTEITKNTLCSYAGSIVTCLVNSLKFSSAYCRRSACIRQDKIRSLHWQDFQWGASFQLPALGPCALSCMAQGGWPHLQIL